MGSGLLRSWHNFTKRLHSWCAMEILHIQVVRLCTNFPFTLDFVRSVWFFCFVSWYLAAGLNANDIRLCCFRLSFSLSLDYIVALFVFVSKTNTQFVEIAKGFLLTLPLEDILYMLFTETQQIYANNCSFGKQRVSSRRVLRQRKMAQSKKNPANRKKRRLKWLRAGFSSGKRNS